MLTYHFAWIPGRKRKVLKQKVKRITERLLREKALELGLDILNIDILPDHVHLFINVPPYFSIQGVMHWLKDFFA